MSEKITVILSENGNPDAVQRDLEKRLTSGLMRRQDVDLTIVPHLYDLASDGPVAEFLKSIRGEMIVLSWLYPRSAYWILHANGIRGRLGEISSSGQAGGLDVRLPVTAGTDDPDRTIWCLDLRTHDRPRPHLDEIERILAAGDGKLEQVAGEARGPASEARESTRRRWYPVIDFERCSNCLECLNFCLFGVFSVDDSETVLIDQADACRSGCPACSRICPQGAIIFPQHDDPAIAGDPSLPRESLKLDLSQLLGGASLADVAAAERDRALKLAGKKRPEDESPSDETEKPSSQDRLDQLVDQVDDLDL